MLRLQSSHFGLSCRMALKPCSSMLFRTFGTKVPKPHMPLSLAVTANQKSGRTSKDSTSTHGKDLSRVVFPDGSSYKGSFQSGKMHGHGQFISTNGSIYEGDFADGELTGLGKVALSNGDLLAGSFERSALHGYGLIEFSDGNTLHGEFREGCIFHGSGQMKLKSGSFTGTWVASKWRGQGKLTYADGHTLQGEFKDGVMYNGKGVQCASVGGSSESVYTTLSGQSKHTILTDSVDTSHTAVGTHIHTHVINNTPTHNQHTHQNTLTHTQSTHTQHTHEYVWWRAPTDASDFTSAFAFLADRPGWSTSSADGSVVHTTSIHTSESTAESSGEGTVDVPVIESSDPVKPTEAALKSYLRSKHTPTSTTVPRYVHTTRAGVVFNGIVTDTTGNGIGSVTYPNGSVYTGEVYNTHPHGVGTYKTTYGTNITGIFKHGTPYTVSGVYKCPNGTVYNGEMYNNKFHGQGTLTHPDGRYIVGEFKEGRIYNGTGDWVNSDGSSRRGTWLFGDATEIKAYTTKSGRVYEGDIVNGRNEGVGTCRYPSGDVYTGSFVNRKRHGNGVLRSADGSVYDGKWANDHKDGHGQTTHANGDHSSGFYVKGLLDTGKVRTTTPNCTYNGTIYNSKWLDGTVMYSNGGVYTGTFESGKIHTGSGNIVFRDGSSYKGLFLNGNKHGLGKIVNIDNTEWEGEFRDGKVYNGHGTYFSHNTVSTGVWVEGLLQGVGRVCSNSNSTSSGSSSSSSTSNSSGDNKAKMEYVENTVEEVEATAKKVVNTVVHTEAKVVHTEAKVVHGVFDTGVLVHGQTRASGVIQGMHGIYTGSVVGGKWHGQGTFSTYNGIVYEGMWVAGQLHGQGTVRTARTLYTGGWFAGKQHGSGTITHTNGQNDIVLYKHGILLSQFTHKSKQ